MLRWSRRSDRRRARRVTAGGSSRSWPRLTGDLRIAQQPTRIPYERFDGPTAVSPRLAQKLGLCRALVCVDDWPHAEHVMDRLPPFAVVACASAASVLCTRLHMVVEPLYRKCVGGAAP